MHTLLYLFKDNIDPLLTVELESEIAHFQQGSAPPYYVISLRHWIHERFGNIGIFELLQYQYEIITINLDVYGTLIGLYETISTNIPLKYFKNI